MMFINSIGIRRWSHQGASQGDVPVEPWLRGPGGGLRIGVAAILADLVIGIPPTGITTSTVDLSVRWTADAPVSGRMTAAGRVVKWGQRLMFGDAALLDESGAVVGWAVGTFVTGEVGGPSDLTTQPVEPTVAIAPHESVADALQVETLQHGELVMPMRTEVMNGPGGTVQGGIQACLAELAAERAAPDPQHVTDLAIRFLSRAKVGPILAVATVLPSVGPDRTVRVELRDHGDGDRPLSDVLATIRPLGSEALAGSTREMSHTDG